MELTKILELGVKQNASDIHLCPGQKPVFRISSELKVIDDYNVITDKEIESELLNLMTQCQQNKFLERLELDFLACFPNIGSFRVNCFHQLHGAAAVLRVISQKIPTLDDLQIPMVFKRILSLTSGLVIISGPTGSGKSTTLAAMVDYINTHSAKHIITIEDPIEFIHNNKKSMITQRQVNRDTKNFSNALRAALREDPDVILIGEMRDLETIRLALSAAETGHLVLATLHSSSAPRSISRMIDVFPGEEKNHIRNLLSESVQAIICQTLVPTKTTGRIAAFEILLGTPAIRNLIRENQISQMINCMQIGSNLGMCTMEQYLKKLKKSNMIELDDCLEMFV